MPKIKLSNGYEVDSTEIKYCLPGAVADAPCQLMMNDGRQYVVTPDEAKKISDAQAKDAKKTQS